MLATASPILITTASAPPDGVYDLKMTNVSKRIITAKAGVFFWAALGASKIVIADATGQDLLNEADLQLLHQMNVLTEQIHYNQDDALIIKRGKGYGEGRLIQFALENSQFLQGANGFFKCTGKMYCRNFPEIFSMIEQHNITNIFWRDAFDYITDTRFFYTSKRFAEQILLPAYTNVDDRNGNFSEVVLTKAVHEHLRQEASTRPILSGFSGGFDQPCFDLSLGYLDQNFPCWMN